MNNNKNIYIIGAGFNNPIGMPSINDFYGRIRNIYYDNADRIEGYLGKCFKNVIDYRNKLGEISQKTKIDLDNIETLFSYLDMDCTMQKQEHNSLRKELIYTIISTLDISTNMSMVNDEKYLISIKNMTGNEKVKYSPGNEDNRNLNIYEYFVCLIAGLIGEREYPYKEHGDTIIGFNYDLLLDNIMHQMGIVINYGIGDKEEDAGIKYLKLHGSANWLYCDSCKNVDISAPKYPKDIEKCAKCGKENIPLIVPPTWNKSQYREQINHVWEKAISEMNNARNIYILGYSMPATDMYFDYLVSLGLKSNVLLDKIKIIDKIGSPPATWREHDNYLVNLDGKYRKLFNNNYAKNRYQFAPIGVLDYIRNQFIYDIKIKQ